jgi:hypothetical protein
MVCIVNVATTTKVQAHRVYERGVVFVLVLVFLSATSYLALYMMVKSLLLVKTVNSLQEQLLIWIKAHNQLLMLESTIQADPLSHQSKRVSFVPDHLGFNCEEGVQIFQAEALFLQSLIAVRE